MQANVRRIANIVVTATVSVAAIHFAAPFLIPIVLGSLLAMLLIRPTDWLERIGLGRALAALASVLLLVSAIALLGFVLSWQVNQLSDDVDQMKERVSARVDAARSWISGELGIDIDEQEKMLKEQGKGTSAQAGAFLFSVLNTLTSVLVSGVLVLIYTYLLIFYRSHLKKFVLRIVPDSKRQNTQEIINKSVAVSGHYLIGLFNMIGILWIMYSIGFTLVGLEGAILFAVICGLLEIVPFFGNFVGNLIAVAAVIAQGGDGGMILGIIGVYLTVQFLQTYLLEPLVVGQQVNINPLFTIMGLAAGELLWGVAGMALAIPVIGIIKIICDHIPSLQPYGMLIGSEKAKGKTSFLRFLKRKFFGR